MNDKSKTSPLRQRMIEDMRMRRFSSHTERDYLRAVKKLADFLGKSPDKATREDLKKFQLHLVDIGTTDTTLNSIVSGLRFFYKYTLDKPKIVERITHVPVPRKLPIILTGDEVGQLIKVATPKYQAAFALGYGAGLRISEIVSLTTQDINSKNMTIHVQQGKGLGSTKRR